MRPLGTQVTTPRVVVIHLIYLDILALTLCYLLHSGIRRLLHLRRPWPNRHTLEYLPKWGRREARSGEFNESEERTLPEMASCSYSAPRLNMAKRRQELGNFCHR